MTGTEVGMPQEASFPRSRHQTRLLWADGADEHVFDLRLAGWDTASRWVLAPEAERTATAWLCRDAQCPAPEIVSAGSGAGTVVAELAVALTEHLALAPEAVVAGLGTAAPHPVLRSPQEIEAALAEQQGDDEYGRAAQEAFTWLLGRGRVRPACEQPWAGGEPDPWQVDAEAVIAAGRAQRENAADRFRGLREALSWAQVWVGPLALWPGEWSRWLGRRLRGRTEVPPVEAPGARCTLGRGPEFRTWQVVDGHGLLGTVHPTDERRWVATIDDTRVSDAAHDSVVDAAYDVAVAAYRAGWAQRADAVAEAPTTEGRP